MGTWSPTSSRGSGGTVTTVSGGDASITVANPTTAPAIETADLATIASLHAAGGSITASSQKITDLATPTLSTDAVTKAYTDAAINGLDWKQACRVASAAALAANTYLNGASGVGATLTGNAFGALTVDGVTVAVNDRVLVKNEVAGSHNGIYSVTATGGGAAFYVLTRTSDYNVTSEIVAGTGVYVTEGTANTDTAWVMTTTGAITVGTTALTFTQFGAAAVASVFGRTGAVVAATGDYYGVVSAALTGATSASRYVGATTGGAPVSGTFAVGDLVIDQAGGAWVCSAAGTPGTWGPAVAAGSITNTHISAGAAIQQSKLAGGGGMVLLSSTTLGSNTTFDVSSIDQTYTDLIVVIRGRTSGTSGAEFLGMRFNNDSGATYAAQDTFESTTTVTGHEVNSATSARCGRVPDDNQLSGLFAYAKITIPNYTSTTFPKVFFFDSCAAYGTTLGNLITTGNRDIITGMGVWNATPAAINRIQSLCVGSTNYKSGAQMFIYGSK